MAVFATALQNICSDLVATEKQAPVGLNVIICLDYSRLQMFLRFFVGQQCFFYRKALFNLKSFYSEYLTQYFWLPEYCFTVLF